MRRNNVDREEAGQSVIVKLHDLREQNLGASAFGPHDEATRPVDGAPDNFVTSASRD